ncbi:MAG: phosphatidylglycerophosphatase A [Gammaproteobacteria bacterium]
MNGRAAVAPIPPALLRDPGHCLALGCGSGLLRPAPGTWGTLVGVLCYWPLAGAPVALHAVLVALLFVLGVPLCGRTARALGTHDHGGIVFDEIVGYLATVTFCSTGLSGALLGFVAFRFFDIVKPWPVRLADRRIGGGFGIMLDDLIAAVYAGATLELFEYLSFSYKLFQ